ncbi:MAG: hypothetical protein RR558_11335, partial [Coprobacillus sp.]
MKINENVKKLVFKNPIFYIFSSILYLELIIRISVFQSINFSFVYTFFFGITFACILGILTRLT